MIDLYDKLVSLNKQHKERLYKQYKNITFRNSYAYYIDFDNETTCVLVNKTNPLLYHFCSDLRDIFKWFAKSPFGYITNLSVLLTNKMFLKRIVVDTGFFEFLRTFIVKKEVEKICMHIVKDINKYKIRLSLLKNVEFLADTAFYIVSFYDNCLDIVTENPLIFTGNDTCFPYFKNLYSVRDIYIDNLDTSDKSSLISFKELFFNCSNLVNITLKNFDNRNIVTMERMFADCSKLERVNFINFNTSNCANMSFMFYSCKSLKSLNLNSFDMSNVETVRSMFEDCVNLKNLDILEWKPSFLYNFDISTSKFLLNTNIKKKREIIDLFRWKA